MARLQDIFFSEAVSDEYIAHHVIDCGGGIFLSAMRALGLVGFSLGGEEGSVKLGRSE